MSHPLATYTFLPWLRQGLSNTIAQDETAANPSLRASVPMQITVRSQGVSGAVPDANLNTNMVRLYGPGDVLGIEPRAVIKTEPRHWITNYEPNNLAHVEFYDEDFPWRYTPAHANTGNHRHRPWIMLVVLAEGEFEEGDGQGRPSPFIRIADLTKLPEKNELWAWAHVQANRNLGANNDVIVNSNGAEIAQRLTNLLAQNQDLAQSRIVCPRKLEKNTSYHAFVIPTFETGRVAGLGLDITKVDDAMRGAWEAHPERANLSGDSFPYYYRWFFRTGIEGDFEYLVRLLKPKKLDARVGRRDIDVQRPGSNLDGILGPKGDGVLRLGGALRIPEAALTQEQKDEAQEFEDWAEPRPHQFQSDLASFINLSDDYSELSATDAHEQSNVPAEIGALPNGDTDPDPLITPPLYGTWHAMTKRLLTRRDGTSLPNTNNWVHQLNLDPRHRTAAGFGTRVVRERQEDYMNAAWEQIGDVLKANNQMRFAQYGMAVSLSWYQRHLVTVNEASPAKFLSLAAPMMKRVVLDGFTVSKRVADSRIPLSVTGVAMRRALRPNGRLMRSLPEATQNDVRNGSIIQGLNDGELTVAQPPAIPSGAATVPGVSEGLVSSLPQWLIDLLRKYPWLPLLLLIILLLIALILFFLLGPAIAIAIAVLAVIIFLWLRQKASQVATSDAILPENENPEVIDDLPTYSVFTLEPFGTVTETRPGSDNPTATQFKEALGRLFEVRRDVAVANTPVVRGPLNLGGVTGTIINTIDPARSFPLRFYRLVYIPDRIKVELREIFIEAMAYPRIDEPMYRPLADIGSELLLPNIGLIPPDSLTLLETNQPFIESYMVGLNHEFARELLWREYPTDQRGSYFRQFWDVTGYQNIEGLSADDLREKLYDIPKLHFWSTFSQLGAHDHRQPPGSPPKNEAVLSVRGELLKRYPTAVVYAHKAAWQTKDDGTIDKSLIRIPAPLTAAEEENPPRDKVKTPLYEAKVDPDITFFGFDLTVEEAKGDPTVDDKPGWFFVIKERPGEPRFGLDIERGGAPLNSWSDLAWDDVTVDNGLLRINAAMNEHSLTVAPPSSEGPQELAQHNEDKQLSWDRNTNAADVAYVLYQLPVLVASHASEMLP